jgi:hypothetical protein
MSQSIAPFRLSCPIVEQWEFLFCFSAFEDGPEATDTGRLEKKKYITAMVALGNTRKSELEYFLEQFLWLTIQFEVQELYPRRKMT